jgi:hypothetical protein
MCSVLLNVVKFSTDGESLSISKGTGEVYKATSMIPKKSWPSIDEFGFRSALEIQKSHSGLPAVWTLSSGKWKLIAHGTAMGAPAIVCLYI